MENSREKGTKMKIFPIYYGQIFPDMTFHDKRIWNGSGIRFDGLTKVHLTHKNLIQLLNKIPSTNLLQLNCKLKSLFHTFDSIILSSLYILIRVLINFSISPYKIYTQHFHSVVYHYYFSDYTIYIIYIRNIVQWKRRKKNSVQKISQL